MYLRLRLLSLHPSSLVSPNETLTLWAEWHDGCTVTSQTAAAPAHWKETWKKKCFSLVKGKKLVDVRAKVSDGLLWRRGINYDKIEQRTEKKTLGAVKSHERGWQEATGKGEEKKRMRGRGSRWLDAANICKMSNNTIAYAGAAKFRFGSVLLREQLELQLDFVGVFVKPSQSCMSYEREAGEQEQRGKNYLRTQIRPG